MFFKLLSLICFLFTTAASAAVPSAFHVVVADRTFGLLYAGSKLSYAVADVKRKVLLVALRPAVLHEEEILNFRFEALVFLQEVRGLE